MIKGNHLSSFIQQIFMEPQRCFRYCWGSWGLWEDEADRNVPSWEFHSNREDGDKNGKCLQVRKLQEAGKPGRKGGSTA